MNSTPPTVAGPVRTASTSPDRVIQDSGLPASLQQLVRGVVDRTRLWREERADIARELCAHFRDGLEAGESADALAGAFGDPSRAARLISTTRKQMRPRWWRAGRNTLRALSWTLAAMIVLYGVLAARVFLFSPQIKRNFMAEMNAPVLATDVSDRAWPLYIEARRQFGPLPDFMAAHNSIDVRRPGDKGWEQMVEWLDAHQEAMDTVRMAATKPVLGYVYRSSMDPDLARAMEVSNPEYKYDPQAEVQADNPLVVGVLLPHLGEMRRNARWLMADANLAASRGERDRYLRDIHAMLGMAEQAASEDILISDLVGLAIAHLAIEPVLEFAATPGLLSDADLRDLAHSITGFAEGRVVIDASMETRSVEDILQRYFSDNGNGDGHFIGGPELEQQYLDFGIAPPLNKPVRAAFQPVQSVLIASRAEIRELANQFVAAAAVDDALPPWRHGERTSDDAYERMTNAGLYQAVPFLRALMSLYPEDGPIVGACASRDIFETMREAALTVLAIESYRRARGGYPSSLAELVPAYLPRIPRDPFDGKPLRYLPSKSASEPPLLYSVGMDGLDNRGVAPTTHEGRQNVKSLRLAAALRNGRELSGAEHNTVRASEGDWILWPVPAPIPEE